jgi:DNA-binding transcriptional MerR regulator
VDQMTIGEFARDSRLSAKALRLYDELGLLPPARVDPDSGYRFYEAGQLERARLVASLRQIGVPLVEIKSMVDLPPPEIAARLVALWADVEADHTARGELVSRLVDRLNGKRRSVMYEVATREIPDRSLLCLKRHVDGERAVWALGKEFIALMKERPLPSTDGWAGAMFLIYHGEVNQDSDGPVEMCRPVPDDRSAEFAARFPELTPRTEAAHEEAFVPLGTAELTAARWQLVSDALQDWDVEQARKPAIFDVRITYVFPSPPLTAASRTECDFAVAFHSQTSTGTPSLQTPPTE